MSVKAEGAAGITERGAGRAGLAGVAGLGELVAGEGRGAGGAPEDPDELTEPMGLTGLDSVVWGAGLVGLMVRDEEAVCGEGDGARGTGLAICSWYSVMGEPLLGGSLHCTWTLMRPAEGLWGRTTWGAGGMSGGADPLWTRNGSDQGPACNNNRPLVKSDSQ